MNMALNRQDKIICFLCSIFPILPLNAYIGPINLPTWICVIIILLIATKKGFSSIIRLSKYSFFHAVWLIIFSCFSMITKNVYSGFSFFITTLVFSVFFVKYFDNEVKIIKLLEYIIFLSFIISILGIYESLSYSYLFQSDLLSGWSDNSRYGLLRCSVTFGHPINFALFQAISAILAYYLMNRAVVLKNKKALIQVAYFSIIISMIMTISRLAICFFVVVQVIVLLRSGVKNSIKKFLNIFLVGAMILILSEISGFDILNLFSDLFHTLTNIIFPQSDSIVSDHGVFGVGNRFELYGWVIAAVGNNYLFGKGVGAEFSYKMYEWFNKTSIEVQYLYIYFQCGLTGLLFLVLGYINNFKFLFKNREIRLLSESKINLMYVLLLLITGYYICLFGIQESDLTRIYIEIIALSFSVYRISKKGKNNELIN